MARAIRGADLVGLVVVPVAVASSLVLCSCRALLYPIIAGAPDPTQKVAAEFDTLSGNRALILIWADDATLFEHPHIRFELAEYVTYHLKEKVKNVALVPNRAVAEYQESDYAWEALPPARIGAKFDTDVVIHIELLEYTTHGAGTQHLLAGRGRAAVTVYQVSTESGEERLYHGEARARYPEKGSLGVYEAKARTVHAHTLDLLALAVARKFYDHEVPL